jgi:hypothetical protein
VIGDADAFIVLPQAEVEAALATPKRVRHGKTI